MHMSTVPVDRCCIRLWTSCNAVRLHSVHASTRRHFYPRGYHHCGKLRRLVESEGTITSRVGNGASASPRAEYRPMNVARRLFSGTKDVKRKTAAPRIGEGVASSHPSPDDQDLVDEEDEEQEAEEEEEDEEEEDEAEGAVPIVARNRKERRDSITETIVKEREAHLRRLAEAEYDPALAKRFKSLSLGSRKRPRNSGNFLAAFDEEGKQVHNAMAAGGFAKWMGSASKGWPEFKHRLPEVALAGHTNCGKSTLVNALSGLHPRKGPASSSDRAGWTEMVGFYQVGKKPPVLTLVDLPGYGHAVATKRVMQGWLRMIKAYITTRETLCRCCVLVDSTRGFCDEDRALLKLLAKKQISHQIVLTKADLVTPELLSACVLLLQQDLSELVGEEASKGVSFSAVCGTSGAGVNALWKELRTIAFHSPGSLEALQAAHEAARIARDKPAREKTAMGAVFGAESRSRF